LLEFEVFWDVAGVVGWVVPSVLKVPQSSKMSETTHPVTHPRTLESSKKVLYSTLLS
jgi:hypothetical protein